MSQHLKNIRHLFKSYSFILAAIYASLFCISIVAVLAYVHHSSYQSRIDEVDQEIANILVFFDETLTLAQYRPEIAVQYIRKAVEEKVNAQPPGDPFIYLLVSINGRKLAGNLPSLPRLPPESVDDEFHREGRFEFELHDETGLSSVQDPVRVQARAGNLFGTHILLVGRNMSDIDVLQRFPGISILSVLVTIALAVAGALLFSKVISRRLGTINDTCHSVIKGAHSKRVTTNESGDAFDQLATNVNEMLDQIQVHIDDVRSVTDHAVHNVKTPLNHMRIRLEKKANSLTSSQDNEEVKKVYFQIIEEVDAVSETFNQSLQIANMRTESGRKSICEQFSVFYPVSLLEDVAQTFRPYAEDSKSIKVCVKQDAERRSDRILAHKKHIRQAISNLVDNAIKFSPRHSTVNLLGSVQGSDFEFVVSDEGEGIAQQSWEKVRVVGFREQSSQDTAEGHGLGLSYVDAVAQVHNVEMGFELLNTDHEKREFRVSLGKFKIVDGC